MGYPEVGIKATAYLSMRGTRWERSHHFAEEKTEQANNVFKLFLSFTLIPATEIYVLIKIAALSVH
jgi:hypothetical protein